jgi:hypothetical protein
MARLAKLPRQRLAIFLAREKGQSNFDRRILTTRFMDVKTKTHFRSNDFTIIDLQGACCSWQEYLKINVKETRASMPHAGDAILIQAKIRETGTKAVH